MKSLGFDSHPFDAGGSVASSAINLYNLRAFLKYTAIEAGEHFLQTFFSFARKPEGAVFASDFVSFFGLLFVVIFNFYIAATCVRMKSAVFAFVPNNPNQKEQKCARHIRSTQVGQNRSAIAHWLGFHALLPVALLVPASADS